MRIASGLALIGAVVAEFVAGTGGQGAGLAYQILMAGIQLNIPRLFAALVLITLAGVAFYGATVWLSRLALRHWHESEVVADQPGWSRPQAAHGCGSGFSRTPSVGDQLQPDDPGDDQARRTRAARRVAASPNSTMPRITVPTAPMPVHTA